MFLRKTTVRYAVIVRVKRILKSLQFFIKANSTVIAKQKI